MNFKAQLLENFDEICDRSCPPFPLMFFYSIILIAFACKIVIKLTSAEEFALSFRLHGCFWFIILWRNVLFTLLTVLLPSSMILLGGGDAGKHHQIQQPEGTSWGLSAFALPL